MWNSLSVSVVISDAPSLSAITSAACILVLIQWVWLKFFLSLEQIEKVCRTVQRDYANFGKIAKKKKKVFKRIRLSGSLWNYQRTFRCSIFCDLLSVTLACFDERTESWLLCCRKIAHIKQWLMILVEMELHNNFKTNLNCLKASWTNLQNLLF